MNAHNFPATSLQSRPNESPSTATQIANLPHILLSPPWLAIGITLLGNLAVSAEWPNFPSSLFATVLFAAAMCLLARASAMAVAWILPYILLQFAMLISLNAIEAGSYMSEVNATGAPSSAATSYVLYSLIFDFSAIFVFRRMGLLRSRSQRIPIRTGDADNFCQIAFLVLASLFVIYLVFVGLQTGFPLLTGTDRFAFRLHTANVLTINFLDLKVIPASALGVCAAFGRTRVARAFAYGVFLCVVAVSFLYGDKFFVIMVAATLFVLGHFARQPEKAAATLLRLLPFGLFIGIGVCAITLYIYSDYGAQNLSFAIGKFGDRVSGQAQLWYLAVRDSPDILKLDLSAISANLKSMMVTNASDFDLTHKLAPYFFVDRYSPPEMYRSVYHNSGMTTPTGLFEAYGLEMIGYAGVAVQMLLAGALLGLINALHFLTIQSKNPFFVFLPAFMIVQMIKLVTQGTIYSILSVSTLKFYALFLVLAGVVEVFRRSFPNTTARDHRRMVGERQ